MKPPTIPVSPPANRQGFLSQGVDPRLLRHVFSQWEPQRPELLIRLRPRGNQEVGHVAR